MQSMFKGVCICHYLQEPCTLPLKSQIPGDRQLHKRHSEMMLLKSKAPSPLCEVMRGDL